MGNEAVIGKNQYRESRIVGNPGSGYEGIDFTQDEI
jgi:hypothetical protein